MKGMLQSFEAVLSILTIFVVFVVVYGTQENLPDFEVVAFKIKAFDAMKSLDDSNQLRQYALTNDTTTIGNKVSDELPAHFNRQVIVCTEVCSSPDIESDKLTSVSYYIAGDVGDFRPRKVVLYVW